MERKSAITVCFFLKEKRAVGMDGLYWGSKGVFSRTIKKIFKKKKKKRF